jgi:lysyl-tRNA synthetase, class II
VNREMNDQQRARLLKLAELRNLGIEPYLHGFKVTHSSRELCAQRESLLKDRTSVSYAGRIVRYNRKGRICFMHIKDAWGRIQAVLSISTVGEECYETVKNADLGDWIGVTGSMFVTKTGEYSIEADGLWILSKTLRPLPVPKERSTGTETEVFDAFTDTETRYRQRYLDLTLNDEVRKVFRDRATVIRSIRSYLDSAGYLEVETPVLQPIYGGANARPFITHHNALDLDLYLRISNELYLKRCIIGGLERVYEFAKDFRNEGVDKTHNPEFTLLEFYKAYADYSDMMSRVEEMISRACTAVHGTSQFTWQDVKIDCTAPWNRIRFLDAIRTYSRIPESLLRLPAAAEMDPTEGTGELERYCRDNEYPVEDGASHGRLLLEIFEQEAAPRLIQPHIVFDFPSESSPLCRRHRTEAGLIEQFEVYIGGMEVGNAYSELIDPTVQRDLLEEQAKGIRGNAGTPPDAAAGVRGDESHPVDHEFLTALEYGMPPTGGAGIGIDRLVMLLTDTNSIRDVLLFPLMKPRTAT